MKLVTEIARTIHAIRCAGDVDVERLCFEVSPEEWRELMRYFTELQGFHGPSGGDMQEAFRSKNVKVMGITVRERPA